MCTQSPTIHFLLLLLPDILSGFPHSSLFFNFSISPFILSPPLQSYYFPSSLFFCATSFFKVNDKYWNVFHVIFLNCTFSVVHMVYYRGKNVSPTPHFCSLEVSSMKSAVHHLCRRIDFAQQFYNNAVSKQSAYVQYLIL